MQNLLVANKTIAKGLTLSRTLSKERSTFGSTMAAGSDANRRRARTASCVRMDAGVGDDDEEVDRQNPHLLLICAAWGCWACILMVIVIFCAAATSDSEALGACSADIDSAAVLIFTLGTVAVLAVTV